MRPPVKIRWIVPVVLTAAVVAATAPSRITRTSLRTLERAADGSFEGLVKDDPMSILGATRAVYLDGYGVVFSTELELSPSAAPNPFRPAFSKEDVARLKEKKRVRIAFLKETMRNMLASFAAGLNTLPANENVALAVTIPYFRWEDSDGLPRQIVMVAPRRILIADMIPPDAVKVQEFF